jgi:hypothetical protein
MDQREHAPLQRHTAEASLDKRENAPLYRYTAEASWASSPPANNAATSVANCLHSSVFRKRPKLTRNGIKV